MKNLLTAYFILSSLFVSATNGTVRGTIYDDKTDETLVGVTVIVKGTTTGTATDLDGHFSLELPTGSYNLQISYISYQTLIIDNIIVSEGEVTLLENIRLKESILEIDEVVVRAEVIRTTESALNTLKKNSAVIMDGISSSRIKLTGDNNAGEAVTRVTGVSAEEGKYIYVRGLGDRYSKTSLNGMDIPGLDPDRNSLQMDIFPTNLIDNMLVSKNFMAEMPADFTGGMLNIETKDFPEQKIISVSAGITYNPGMHFNPDYLTYPGGSSDFLGFDDGTRALPERAGQSNIPTPVSGASQQEISEFIKSFNPQLGVNTVTSPVSYSINLSLGNQINLSSINSRSPELGYIFSLSYKSDFKYYDDVLNSEYQRYIDPMEYNLRYATIQNGKMGEHNVLAGILGGLALKTTFSKIRLTGIRLQNGESRAAQFHIENNGEAVGQSGYTATSDNLEYNQRALSNLLLNGTHLINTTGWEIDWRISPTLSTSEDPDIRKTAFTHTTGGSSFMAGAGGNPARIWRSLTELNANAKIDIAKKYKFRDRDAILKFGLSHTYKERDYEILFFDIQFFGGQSWPDPDPSIVLNPENIYPNRPNSIYYQSGNSQPNPNEYKSNINNTGIYLANELSISPKVKTILGLRIEDFRQRHTGRDQRYAAGDIENGRNLDNEIVLQSVDLFPSLNLIYSISEEQKIRASYSKTIARPSFKELSFAQILDPVSNRIFNGALFTYPGWDGNLTETRINNFDLRWELFMKRDQIVSVSGFIKTFDDPIEMVRIPEQQTSTEYQPRNVGNGILYGLEFEFRKDLDFISRFWKNFNFSGNLTMVKSSIEMTQAEYNSRKTFEKTGEYIDDKRQMAGQSPYVINAGLTYASIDAGIDAGLFYNVKGKTLSIVGAGLFPDIYISPFNNLNFSFSKFIGESRNTSVDFKISNILNSGLKSYYSSFRAEDKIYSKIDPGRSFSLGINYKF